MAVAYRQIYGRIYTYRCRVNSKIYVGQTTAAVFKRRRQHEVFRRSPKRAIHKAIKKYGIAEFEFSVVYELFATGIPVDDQASLNEAEASTIETFSSRNWRFGYNRKGAGSNGRHATSTKKKISAANKKMLRAFAVARKGIPRSAAMREKIRLAKLGKPTILRGVRKSPQHAAKLRVVCLRNAEAMRGKPAHNRGKPSGLKGKPAHPNSIAALRAETDRRRGKPGNTAGLLWATDGASNRRLRFGDTLPEKWYYGRVMKPRTLGAVR